MYNTPVNLQSCNLPGVPNFLMCLLQKQFVWPERWRSQHFSKLLNADKLAKKIPKSVNVTDFPFEQLFKYLVYLAELCCDSKNEVLIDGRSWSRSCHLAVGMVGVIGTFSFPLTCIIPHADSCTIVCTVRQRHRYKSGSFLL